MRKSRDKSALNGSNASSQPSDKNTKSSDAQLSDKDVRKRNRSDMKGNSKKLVEDNLASSSDDDNEEEEESAESEDEEQGPNKKRQMNLKSTGSLSSAAAKGKDSAELSDPADRRPKRSITRQSYTDFDYDFIDIKNPKKNDKLHASISNNTAKANEKKSKADKQNSSSEKAKKVKKTKEKEVNKTKKKESGKLMKRGKRKKFNDSDDEVQSDITDSLDGDDGDRSDKGSDEDDDSLPKIQILLTREKHTNAEWKEICSKMNTYLVTNGSKWILDDELEAARNEDEEEERYLVKWKDESYLHITWETAEDLQESTDDGKTAFRIQKANLLSREEDGSLQRLRDTFGSQCFQPECKQIERIVDEDTVSESDDNGDSDKKDKQKSSMAVEKSASNEKGSSVLWCAVKWFGLGYDEITWELMDDITDIGGMAALIEMRKRNTIPPHLVTSDLRKKVIKKVKERIRPKANAISLDSKDLNFKNDHKLRAYQVTAVKWLLFNWMSGRGSILADEMGLGKTCQTVAFSHLLKTKFDCNGAVLIVAPLATLQHWIREFTGWTDLNIIIYHGNMISRNAIREYEFYYKDPKTDKNITECFKFDVLITNFETLTQDYSHLCKLPWSLLVVDEAHRLKNRESVLFQTITGSFKYDARLLLTGTPIQNSISELYTLLEFADPGAFGSWQEFCDKYGNLSNAQDIENFHEMLKPYLLRRFKADVEESLPLKEETIIEVELTQIQKKYYRAIYERNISVLTSSDLNLSSKVSLNNVAMQLRKCCIHPYLLDGVEEKLLRESGKNASGEKIVHGHHKKKPENDTEAPFDEALSEQTMNTLITSSGKMILLDKLLNLLKENGRRVLIFSQMTRMLDILEDYLMFRQYGYERIDGSVSMKMRQEAIDRYSKPGSKSFCFLLSTRGCGQGINLTSADTVIMFDSDWNPQNDVQAQARCHRIGQTKNVQVYRLVTRKTYEWEMFQRAGKKLGFERALLIKTPETGIDGDESYPSNPPSALGNNDDDQDENNSENEGISKPRGRKKKGASKAKDTEEVVRLLKMGAYSLTEDEEKARADEKAFCEADIHDLLKRSKVIKFDLSQKEGSTSTSENGKSSDAKTNENRFSTATFVSSASGVVDVDDPEFWVKVFGDKAAQKIENAKKRKNGDFFGNGDDTEDEDNEGNEDDERDDDVPGRRRSRRKYAGNYYNSFAIDDEDEETLSVDSSSNAKSKKKGKSAGDEEFTPVDLGPDGVLDTFSMKRSMQLHRGVLRFGVKRWDDVLEQMISKVELESLTRLGKGLVIVMLYYFAVDKDLIKPKNLIPTTKDQKESANVEDETNDDESRPKSAAPDATENNEVKSIKENVEEFYYMLLSHLKSTKEQPEEKEKGDKDESQEKKEETETEIASKEEEGTATTANSENKKNDECCEFIFANLSFMKSMLEKIYEDAGDDKLNSGLRKIIALPKSYFQGSFSESTRKSSSKVIEHINQIEAFFAAQPNFADLLKDRLPPSRHLSAPWWTMEDDMSLLEGFIKFGWKFNKPSDTYDKIMTTNFLPGYKKALDAYKEELNAYLEARANSNESNQNKPSEERDSNEMDEEKPEGTVGVTDQENSEDKTQNDQVPKPPAVFGWGHVSVRFSYLVGMVAPKSKIFSLASSNSIAGVTTSSLSIPVSTSLSSSTSVPSVQSRSDNQVEKYISEQNYAKQQQIQQQIQQLNQRMALEQRQKQELQQAHLQALQSKYPYGMMQSSLPVSINAIPNSYEQQRHMQPMLFPIQGVQSQYDPSQFMNGMQNGLLQMQGSQPTIAMIPGPNGMLQPVVYHSPSMSPAYQQQQQLQHIPLVTSSTPPLPPSTAPATTHIQAQEVVNQSESDRAKVIEETKAILLMFGLPKTGKSDDNQAQSEAHKSMFPYKVYSPDQNKYAFELVVASFQRLETNRMLPGDLELLESVELLKNFRDLVDSVEPLELYRILRVVCPPPSKVGSASSSSSSSSLSISYLPATWDNLDDLSLLSAVCKYGYSSNVAESIVKNNSPLIEKYASELQSGSLNSYALLTRFQEIVSAYRPLPKYVQQAKASQQLNKEHVNNIPFTDTTSSVTCGLHDIIKNKTNVNQGDVTDLG